MGRFWPLAPLFAVSGYFVVALAIFSLIAHRRGLPADPEVNGRPASRLLGRYLRHYIMWVLAPWERGLVRLGVSPNLLTLASLAASLAAGACLAVGRFGAGGWLYLLTGMLDILDGRVARATNRVSRGGAFFDSVIDRYAELAVFSGLAFYYRDRWVLGVVLMAAVGSVMVSYVRARGESLGADVKVGAMQRPERLFYLGLLVAQSPVWEAFAPSAGAGAGRPLFAPAVVALVLLGVSANFTAVRRILHSLRQLESAPPSPRASNAEAPGADGLPRRNERAARGLFARPRPVA